ncbi:sigma-54-dependent transcriptional regulator [Methylophilus medardicus]|uniref:Sigma-54-dependent Fis family transcriptional regulator n=1 Tax=Methylophilus medardicus TaxID=2588534 RepID=A0A5B8CSB3_9PROT|nr:sigma-54 dependent transcriptional regulator [Methylophilus medardicus]QDC44089.1 sigma-54-dependent Fis family transcriptional regulator [Methylophilus medardicus]QDC49096.1 sigma-54-dependent Fis family transcriptional regulator [Methylophilus medardicus]QDC52801.1 sigma-54-dependent Fis family transcriptional regulator [Methylophilus medardicus]
MLSQLSSTTDKSVFLPIKKKVLLVEDEVLFAKAVVKRLQKAGFECEHAESLQDARLLVKQFEPDMALLDMRLPDGNGLDLLADFVAKNINTIVMTAFGDVTDAVNAIKMGAIDYLKKPIDLEELLLIIQKNEKTTDLQASLDYSRQRDSVVNDSVQLIGESAAMQSVRQQITRIAQLSALSDAVQPTVLITGETGTGKDVVARYLHASCANHDKPFVHVDCASLPAELIESELFGHEKGAFTNAVASRPGLIESAEDGTLFLDEIGELPLGLQAKLLNVLERRMVRRLGSTKERPVQARIIAATNRDLYQMSSEGRFRSDLYYRLNVITMQMPPLRDRGQDVLLLANYFRQLTEKRYALPHHEFSTLALMAIQKYHWPGNVREMRHQISRAVLMCTQPMISEHDLGLPQMAAASASVSMQGETQVTLDDAEKAMLLNALEQSRHNVSKAARLLGITRMTMRYRMDKHGISV